MWAETFIVITNFGKQKRIRKKLTGKEGQERKDLYGFEGGH